MRKIKIALVIICAIQLLSCETVKRGLGIEKSSPDSFLVEKRQSILIPPDYNLILPDSKTKNNSANKEEDINLIFNQELRDNKKTTNEIKNSTNISQNKEIENQILNNIK